MALLTTTYRILRNTTNHLTRNFWHNLAAILVMSLTFFVTAVFVLAAITSNKILTYFENQPQITAFFKEEASEDYIQQVKKVLENTGKTSKVSYVSKSQALEIYRQQNIDEPELLEFVTADILPASLEVSAAKIEYLSELAQILGNDTNVEKVIFQKDVVEALQHWTKNARIIGGGLIAFLGFVSILIVLVVISLNIGSFSKEIEIMRLVGASSWYIRWPFLLDGAFFGIVAAACSMGALYFTLPRITSWASKVFVGANVFPIPQSLLLNLWVGTTGLGIVLGITGSLAAIWRHLRV